MKIGKRVKMVNHRKGRRWRKMEKELYSNREENGRKREIEIVKEEDEV